MYEFREGLVHANLSGRIKFLIPIIFDKCQFGVDNKDLRFYLENHTYIEHDNNNLVNYHSIVSLVDCIALLLPFIS